VSDIRYNPEEMAARGYDPDAIAKAELARVVRVEALALIERIEAAFHEIPRPTITRSVARGYDDEWNLSEARIRELAIRDPENDWRDVSDEAIETHQEYFSFSDPEGCRFYLPAYMRHYLKAVPYAEHDAVYWACTKPRTLEALTETERACVDRFLEICHRFEIPRLRRGED
jgi:hypothetical protein